MRRALAVALLLALAGSVGAPAAAQGRGPEERPQNFLWIFGKLYQDPATYENLLAFAKRHDLFLILAPASVTEDQVESSGLEEALRRAKEHGLAAWLNTGVFRAKDGWPTAEVILNTPEWRAKYKRQLQEIVAVYLAHYPRGHLILGHEDPLFSNWPAEDTTSLKRYGAEMFRLQRDAVKELDPDARVALFLLPSTIRDVYPVIMPDLKAARALPDFNLIDKYRGYGDPRLGLEENDERTRQLIHLAKSLTGGSPVYFLGQDHTINTGYTPSRRAILGNLDAALDAGVAGMGWYIRTRHVKTSDVSTLGRTVEPFLPTVGEVDKARYSTFTGDRDRFMYAYLATFESQRLLVPEERFDLWIHGADLDLHEARVYLKTTDGEWEFVGDIGSYVGGDNPYSLDGRTGAVIFHALRRDRFVRQGTVEAKVVARGESDGLEIRGVYAVPYAETAAYVTEADAASRLEADRASVRARSLAHREWEHPTRLGAGEMLGAVLTARE